MFNKFCLLLFLFIALNICAQHKQIFKSISFGYSFSGALNTPNVANTPHVFYKSNQHEVFIGLDIYSMTYKTGAIYGLQSGYKYYLRPIEKKVNFFIAGNLQYVQFGKGQIWAVPYNFLPTDDPQRGYNLIQTKSFSNTFGLGITMNTSNRLSFLIECSGGYNISNYSYSPTNLEKYGIAYVEIGNKTIFTPFIKIGAGFKIYKWTKVVSNKH